MSPRNCWPETRHEAGASQPDGCSLEDTCRAVRLSALVGRFACKSCVQPLTATCPSKQNDDITPLKKASFNLKQFLDTRLPFVDGTPSLGVDQAGSDGTIHSQ